MDAELAINDSHCRRILERLFIQRNCGVSCDVSVTAKTGETIYYHSLVLEGKRKAL